MTRIIAGVAGGRRLQVPPSRTRPTSDRVREALFSAIGSRRELTETHVLDLYAGSGAIGLEALSRGADKALLVEADRQAAAVVRRNIAVVNLPGATLRTGTVAQLLTQPPPARFDVVFADPPYDLPTAAVVEDLQALTQPGWLQLDALIIVERSIRSAEITWPVGYTALKTRRYGETRIEWAEFDC